MGLLEQQAVIAPTALVLEQVEQVVLVIRHHQLVDFRRQTCPWLALDLAHEKYVFDEHATVMSRDC